MASPLTQSGMLSDPQGAARACNEAAMADAARRVPPSLLAALSAIVSAWSSSIRLAASALVRARIEPSPASRQGVSR